MIAVWIVLGAALGGTLVFLWARTHVMLGHANGIRVGELERALRERDVLLTDVQRDLGDARVHLMAVRTQLEHERASASEKVALLEGAEQKLADRFRALSADALTRNSEAFFEIARTSLGHQHQLARGELEARAREIDNLVRPLRESLDKVDARMVDLEKARTLAHGTLTEQVRALAEAQLALQAETHNLARALRAPQVRGRWGEIQLKRVVEMAGMVEHCDFMLQETLSTDDDGRLRPDMIIHLPNGRSIVVDSKAPLQAYLDAVEATDDVVRANALRQHAQQIRTHIRKLSEKAYWDHLESTPELVVLFLPGESFYSAALELDPALIETAVEKRVVLATPTTLIALLRAVSYGWRQDTITREALKISALGKELYTRVRVMAQHFTDMRKALDRTVVTFNRAVSSMETRVLPSARKFRELGAVSMEDDIPQLEAVDQQPRALQAPELVAAQVKEDLPLPPPRVVQTEL
jgi:DNA recombination protein RmuC